MVCNNNTTTNVANALQPAQPGLSVVVVTDANKPPVIEVSLPGGVTTLAAIDAALPAIHQNRIENKGNGVWQINDILRVMNETTLNLRPVDGVSSIRLRSVPGSDAPVSDLNFAALDTNGGKLVIEDITITSWNPATNAVDTNHKDGRAYVRAQNRARMDIRRSNLSYLGFSGSSGRYGVSWRGETIANASNIDPATAVLGDLIDSTLSFNYYGFYSYNAKDMKITGNKVHSNISYGLDPHDYSFNLLIENNDFYGNGNHGCVLSRGVYGSIVRNNRSFNNTYTIDTQDRGAHGFMLDPGSPNSETAPSPSFNITLENNTAWNNDGYGLRVLDSYGNTIRGNRFYSNTKGISIEGESRDNLVIGNVITQSSSYGIHVITGATRNRIQSNQVSDSGFAGIMVRTSNNTIISNTVRSNGKKGGLDEARGDGILLLAETSASSTALPMRSILIEGNTVQSNSSEGIEIRGGEDITVTGNTVTDNGDNGVYISDHLDKGSTQVRVNSNVLLANRGYGLRASGAGTQKTRWRSNSIYRNSFGGILVSPGVNNNIQTPVINGFDGTVISGTATPGASIELFSDSRSQAEFPERLVTANSSGYFEFRLSAPLRGARPNVTATTTNGDSSSLAFNAPEPILDRRIVLPSVMRQQ
jgi:parallel beta-helix repeat protein